MDPLKQGKKTSEFWLTLLFFATVIANGTQYINIPEDQMAMLAGIAFGYAGGRVLVKNTTAKQTSMTEKPNA